MRAAGKVSHDGCIGDTRLRGGRVVAPVDERAAGCGVFMASSSDPGSSPASMDDDCGYASMIVEQKQDLPSVPFFFPSAADSISRINIGLVIAVGMAEDVSNLKRAFPYVFILIFEKRAGHSSPCGPCGCPCGFIPSFGFSDFEFFGVQRMLSPSPTDLFVAYTIPGKVGVVTLPRPLGHQADITRQKAEHEQPHHGGRHGNRFHSRTPDPRPAQGGDRVYGKTTWARASLESGAARVPP